MGRAKALFLRNARLLTEICLGVAHARVSSATSGTSLGVTVWDLLYVGLTIVIFAVLILIVKGVERFER
jgi:hypothetical protein